MEAKLKEEVILKHGTIMPQRLLRHAPEKKPNYVVEKKNGCLSC